MIELVQSLKENTKSLWIKSGTEFQENGVHYSLADQIQSEQEIDHLIRPFIDKFEKNSSGFQKNKTQLKNDKSEVRKTLVHLLNMFGCKIDGPMEERFSEVTDEFLRKAHEFDPNISFESVYQALRNVWIMNAIQVCMHRDICLTPSIFAYSLLYPYTDNYLDSTNTRRDAKCEFNRRLSRRLEGEKVLPVIEDEKYIFDLIHIIEQEFDRTIYHRVFESLVAIHNAQIRSIAQQTEKYDIGIDELLDITFEKGGTSVLADGYLVAGDLRIEDAEFLFQFGAVLQFIDDLQDICEDSTSHQNTVMVVYKNRGKLIEATNRLFSFLENVFSSPYCNESGQDRRIYNLMERGCRLLILDSIASNRKFYHPKYVSTLEQHSPVRFEYLLRLKENMKDKLNKSGQTKNRLNALLHTTSGLTIKIFPDWS